MAFDEPAVRLLFPVPLVTVRLHDCTALNARLLAEIGARRAAEPGIDRSNRYGWHSDNDLFARTEPAHRKLAEELRAIVASSSAKLMPDLPGDLIPSHDGWVNVNPPGAMNAPHDHPGAFWSGVYYVQVRHPPIPTTSCRARSSSSTRADRSAPMRGSTRRSRAPNSPSARRRERACYGRAISNIGSTPTSRLRTG